MGNPASANSQRLSHGQLQRVGAEAVGRDLGIDTVFAESPPEHKDQAVWLSNNEA